jgi:hypothetical protein
MVLVEIDGNYINAESMKSKTEGSNDQSLPHFMRTTNSKQDSQTNNTLYGQ